MPAVLTAPKGRGILIVREPDLYRGGFGLPGRSSGRALTDLSAGVGPIKLRHRRRERQRP